MVLGKSDKKEICCLVAINNTAGLHAESSFHIPKSVQLDIPIVRPCAKPNSPAAVEFAWSVFPACPVDGAGLCGLRGVTEVGQACSQGQGAQAWAVLHQKQGVRSLPRCSLENLHNNSC